MSRLGRTLMRLLERCGILAEHTEPAWLEPSWLDQRDGIVPFRGGFMTHYPEGVLQWSSHALMVRVVCDADRAGPSLRERFAVTPSGEFVQVPR